VDIFFFLAIGISLRFIFPSLNQEKFEGLPSIRPKSTLKVRESSLAIAQLPEPAHPNTFGLQKLDT
jgi:hypothetical protein